MTLPPSLRLTADCTRCAGLCCVAPAFAASADFAIDKPAGTPCPNLEEDFRCGIHARLRPAGFAGCTVYDCFGAGQAITQGTVGGGDWRSDPVRAAQLFQLLPVVRHLHEIARYLIEALALTSGAIAGRPGAGRLGRELAAALERTSSLTLTVGPELLELDLAAHRAAITPLLRRTGEMARAGHRGPDHSGADMVGADLRDADLRGACLRGTLLVAADLRGADLRRADLTGADLRAADLCGADLTGALFVTGMQFAAARGDRSTRLPAGFDHPGHWPLTPAKRRAEDARP